MSRISVSLSGIERTLLTRLAEANAAATLSSLRISTGSKINYPRDDPAAFVMLSGLQSRLGNVRATMSNVTAASSMVTQVQSTLDSIRTQLNTVRTELLKDEDGSLTEAQRADAQANIDAAITQINSLAATEIDGRRLLDGSANFKVSGRDSSQVTDMRVYSTGGSTVTIAGEVTTAATQSQLVYTGDASDQVTDAATFTLTGDLGNIEISVTVGQNLSAVATEVNNNSHKTGVTASVDAVAHTLTFTSVNYGSNADATIDVSIGTFIVTAGQTTTDAGTDVQATINGQTYTGDGNQVSISRGGVQYNVEFFSGFTGTFNTITVSSDALAFALSTDVSRRSTLAIPGVQAARLGGLSGRLDHLASGGTLDDLGSNTSQAIRVVDEALAELTRTEGAVDGFYNAAITSASGLLSDMEDNLESVVDDVNLVDTTEESTRLALYQDLAANSIAGLAILRQQRSSIVNVLQQIAGLLQT
ncbi:MAG: flagellin N-terminal helical domain-containing protein [Planctomycetota bacterium]|jgi:flagellin